MPKNTNFEQFSGPGRSYAEMGNKTRQPVEHPTPAPQDIGSSASGPSEEDIMRSNLRKERAGIKTK